MKARRNARELVAAHGVGMKLKNRLVTTIICDRAWGRYTTSWLCSHFPELKGRTLEFRSDRAVEVKPELYLWLQCNRYLR